MARKRRRRRNPPRVRRHRRRHSAVRRHGRRRRNPFGGGLVSGALTNVKRGGVVVLGKAVTRAVPGFVGLPVTGPMSWAVQAGVALVLGMFGSKLLGHELNSYLVAGGFGGIIESVIKTTAPNLPILGTALGEAPEEAIAGIGAYADPGVGAYAQLSDGGDFAGW